MALVIASRVKESATTTGTGNFTLGGAVSTFRAFSAVCANNDYVHYVIYHKTANEWEEGLGQWQTGGTLVRTAGNVLNGSSGAGSLVSFSSGDKEVFITNPTEHRLVLPQLTADPPAPSSGALVYTRPIAGRSIPRFIGPSGVDSALQPMMSENSITLWLPGTGTTAAISFGVSWTVSATQAHPAIADTNIMTSIKRATFTTTTTAGNASGVRSTAACVIPSKGFFFAARGGILTYHSAMQIYIGLGAASGIIAGDPSAANNSCGFCKDTAKTVWGYYTRDGSTTNLTDTSENTAAGGAADVYAFYIFCPPGGTSYKFRMVDLTGPTVIVNDAEKTTNLPVSTTPLYAHAENRNVTGGAGVTTAIFLSKMYLETDL